MLFPEPSLTTVPPPAVHWLEVCWLYTNSAEPSEESFCPHITLFHELNE
jgi:hypothetical protein